MALADLLDAIEVEADEELERVERESREEAERIVAVARSEADRLEAELVAAVEPGALAEAARIRALARVDAAAEARDLREQAFLTLLDAVRARLAQVRSADDYPERLAALLAEAREALPGAVALRVDPADAELAASLAGGLSVEPVLQTWGGVELDDGAGRVLRNTLEHRFENAEPLLRLLVAQRLAAGETHLAGAAR